MTAERFLWNAGLFLIGFAVGIAIANTYWPMS